MKSTSLPRILIPILFAVVTVAVLLGFLWWELQQSTGVLLKTTPNQNPSVNIIQPIQRTNVQASDGPITALRQGDIYALEGNWTAAEVAYNQAVQEDGGLAALRKLAQAQLQRRNYTDAKETINQLAQKGASEPDIMLLNSIVLLRTGEIVQAREVLSTASDSPQAHYGLALLAIAEGNHVQAKQELALVQAGYEPVLRSNAQVVNSAYEEYALFPDSSNEHLITLLARALSQVQECELALPLLTQVTQNQPEYRDAWLVQGYCELFTERAENAINSFETAYNLDPQKTATQYFLGRAYYAREDYQNAITFFEYALGNGFKPALELHALIANAAQLTNQFQLAFTHLGSIIQTEKTAENFADYMQTGIQSNLYNDVYNIGLEATQQFPEEAALQELFGIAAQEIGNIPTATQAFTTALQLDPQREISQERLKELE